MQRLGLIINGVEFIPADIVDRHTPFAVPHGQTAVVAWALSDEEYYALAVMDSAR